MTEQWFARMHELYGESPVHELFGMELVDVARGEARIGFTPRPEHRNAMNVVHGGILAAIVDSALLQSVRTLLGPDDRPTTLELKINYVAPAVAEPFACTGRAIRVGGSVGVAEALLTDANGEPVASALGTIHVKRARRG